MPDPAVKNEADPDPKHKIVSLPHVEENNLVRGELRAAVPRGVVVRVPACPAG